MMKNSQNLFHHIHLFYHEIKCLETRRICLVQHYWELIISKNKKQYKVNDAFYPRFYQIFTKHSSRFKWFLKPPCSFTTKHPPNKNTAVIWSLGFRMWKRTRSEEQPIYLMKKNGKVFQSDYNIFSTFQSISLFHTNSYI